MICTSNKSSPRKIDEFETWKKKMTVKLTKLKLLSKKNKNIFKDEITKYENFIKIHDEIRKTGLIFEDIKPICKSIVIQIKSLSYKIESKIKFEKSDYEAFIEKYKFDGKKILQLFKDLTENEIIRDKEQDINKIIIQMQQSKQLDISLLDDINFYPFNYTNSQLCDFALKGLTYLNLPQSQGINIESLKLFIEELCQNYHIVPYHNFTHAFSLYQMLYSLYRNGAFKDYLDDFTVLTCLLSSLGHDLDHKGVNNLYHIKKKSELSKAYSEQAVLEYHHSAQFIDIVTSAKFDLLRSFDNNKLNQFKKLSITSILATDMTNHNDIMKKISHRLEKTKQLQKLKEQNTEYAEKDFQGEIFDSNDFESKKLISNIMVHAVDIGNPCLSYLNYVKWASLITQEFDDQTILEADKGLPVTEFLRYKSVSGFYGGQIFFSKILLIETFVLPLWQLISELIPEANKLVENIQSNIQILAQEKEKEDNKN